MPSQTEPDFQPIDAALEPQPPADPQLESEPEPTPERALDSPPWEPEYPAQPDEVISRPQIQRTVQKSLIFGFVAIIAVLGVLLFYRVLDRQQSTEPQSAVIEKAQPAAATAQKPKSTGAQSTNGNRGDTAERHSPGGHSKTSTAPCSCDPGSNRLSKGPVRGGSDPLQPEYGPGQTDSEKFDCQRL